MDFRQTVNSLPRSAYILLIPQFFIRTSDFLSKVRGIDLVMNEVYQENPSGVAISMDFFEDF